MAFLRHIMFHVALSKMKKKTLENSITVATIINVYKSGANKLIYILMTL